MVPPRRPLVAITNPYGDELELVQLVFTKTGFDVTVIASDSPTQFAQEVKELNPDVVVYRAGPGHAATAFIMALRSCRTAAHVPMLILTTDPRFELHEAARAAGADRVLVLPVEPLHLVEEALRLLTSVVGIV